MSLLSFWYMDDRNTCTCMRNCTNDALTQSTQHFTRPCKVSSTTMVSCVWVSSNFVHVTAPENNCRCDTPLMPTTNLSSLSRKAPSTHATTTQSLVLCMRADVKTKNLLDFDILPKSGFVCTLRNTVELFLVLKYSVRSTVVHWAS